MRTAADAADDGRRTDEEHNSEGSAITTLASRGRDVLVKGFLKRRSQRRA